ncbi:hypothetical protein [Secundilactobacillus folii]|uniref:D-alanyl-D-alanine carboxypeptidase n=1 Tax=Secundilactobacillus folii TaxID=2678357 RepID=A0A7X2XZF5_9LACO|nr:hypothetical protein [Secundilactobacillus folii]MTV83166.1 hypothetical protein [Secundilactobacillus folii]
MKKATMLLSVVLVLSGIGAAGVPVTTHAATKAAKTVKSTKITKTTKSVTATKTSAAWKVVKTKKYPTDPAFYVKKTASRYMWNSSHTKKLHNLKNYPKTTWYLSKSVELKLGKKAGIYYQVANNTGKVSGLVYRNYLTKGNNPKDVLANSSEVKSYGGGLAAIKSVREAATLQADILALFPGTILNRTYSAAARNDLNAGVNNSAKYSKTDRNAKAVGIFSPYNWISTTSKTNYTKLITSKLEAQGYTATKRSKYKGYQIGIYATPHGYASNYHKWVSGYGSFGIYLVPTSDAKLG